MPNKKRDFILLSSGDVFMGTSPMSVARNISKHLLSNRKKKVSFEIADIITKKDYRYSATKTKQNNKYVIDVSNTTKQNRIMKGGNDDYKIERLKKELEENTKRNKELDIEIERLKKELEENTKINKERDIEINETNKLLELQDKKIAEIEAEIELNNINDRKPSGGRKSRQMKRK